MPLAFFLSPRVRKLRSGSNDASEVRREQSRCPALLPGAKESQVLTCYYLLQASELEKVPCNRTSKLVALARISAGALL